MPRGDKSSYTSKQKRQAEHIAASARKRGASAKTAARIGWATVNKQDHGGKLSGSGKTRDTAPRGTHDAVSQSGAKKRSR